MTEETDGSWSFEEALARTSEPRLWDKYQAEKRQQTPTLADLRRSLIAGLLAKIGTKLFAAAPKTMKNGDGWAMLDQAALEERIANERTDEIRLFAPLKAPNAAEHLKGRGLAETFQQCVLDDPEVTVLLDRTGKRPQLEGGRCPLGPYIDYHWPLDATASNFEYRLLRDGLLSFGGPEPRPTREVVALSEALADRIGALRALLVSGKIQALGLTADFVESLVPARLWNRKNLSIDVANGDLCEQDDRRNFSPLWTSVELRPAARETVPREEPVLKAAAPAGKRSPRGREVERIIEENEIDVGRLGRKAAASEVMRHMESPPQSANQVKALEVQVLRIWKVLTETS
jgi:hypothetical protein